jgi:hypothetical protein
VRVDGKRKTLQSNIWKEFGLSNCLERHENLPSAQSKSERI